MDLKRSCFGVVLLIEILLADATVYVSDPKRSMMIEFYAVNEPCRIINNGAMIRSMMRRMGKDQVRTIDSQDLNDLAASCTNTVMNNVMLGFTYPGTKWCGPGNRASNHNDLGVKSEVDRCCREHDHCPMTLEAGQCRHGICNISPFTRSHCDCDNAFKTCLRQVNNEDARIIGILYFDIVQVTCFKESRNCPTWMRNDPSYSWFCDEWKFLPVDKYGSVPETATNATRHPNGILDSGRKPLDRSKIDYNLHVLYRTDEDIEKMMENPKSDAKV